MKAGLAAVAATVGLLVVAGCGGGGKAPGVASLAGSSANGGGATTTTVGKQSKQSVTQLYHTWADCMRQHGVQMDDPTIDSKGLVTVNGTGAGQSGGSGGPSGSSGPPQAFQDASKACEPQLQAAQRANGGGKTPAKPDPARMLNFSKCMRAHGLADFPDPTGTGLQISSSAGSDLNPDNPTFQKAQQACQKILGSPKGGMRVQMGGPSNGGGSSNGGAVSGSGKG